MVVVLCTKVYFVKLYKGEDPTCTKKHYNNIIIHSSIKMNLKLSLFITLAVSALTVLAQAEGGQTGANKGGAAKAGGAGDPPAALGNPPTPLGNPRAGMGIPPVLLVLVIK